MQPMYSEVDTCALACLYNLVFKLFLNLLNNLLYTCGMDTSVGNKLMQSQTAYLTTNGIESTDNNCFRRIVNHNFDSRSSLKSTYIAPLTPDDTAFHFIIIYMEHADTVLYRRLRGHTLYGLYHNLACLSIGIQLGLVHYLIDVALGIGLGLILHRLYKPLLGLVSTEP